jgi:hypothetical protein
VIELTDKDLKQLQQIVFNRKMEELFEEPSTYEDEDENE